jgi:microcystin synthetase protein McyD
MLKLTVQEHLWNSIEIKAIAEALCVNRRKSNPLLVGSLKTNLGHLAAAAEFQD